MLAVNEQPNLKERLRNAKGKSAVYCEHQNGQATTQNNKKDWIDYLRPRCWLVIVCARWSPEPGFR